jgi:hypothetical protein
MGQGLALWGLGLPVPVPVQGFGLPLQRDRLSRKKLSFLPLAQQSVEA